MKRLRCFAYRSALLAAASISWPAIVTANSFFDGPAASPQEEMFFSIYSVLPLQNGSANMQRIADGGFTTAGPYYGDEGDPTIDSVGFYNRINDAASHGLEYAAHIPDHPAVINDTTGNIRPNSMLTISEQDLRMHVRDVMDYTLNHTQANDTVSAWYIRPEELRYWKQPEVDYLDVVADEIKLYDPLARPITMYNPNHRQASELVTMVQLGLDRTTMGVYATDVPFDTRGARIADGVNRIVTAASITETTPMAVFELSQDFDLLDLQQLSSDLNGTTDAETIEHVIRHDVYQGLLRGIEAIQVWSGCDCRVGLTTFSEQLDGYISVSDDLNGSLGLANVFLHGEQRTDVQATLLSGPSTVTHLNTTIDSLVMSNIAYDGARYLFLANSANAPLSVNLAGLPTSLIDIGDLFGNTGGVVTDPLTGDAQVNLDSLEVIALEINPIILPPSVGDFNLSGGVDVMDYQFWSTAYGSSVPQSSGADGNMDGLVNAPDFTVWRDAHEALQSSSQTESTVPEPTSNLLFAWVMAYTMQRKRRLLIR